MVRWFATRIRAYRLAWQARSRRADGPGAGRRCAFLAGLACLIAVVGSATGATVQAGELLAGAAKVDITNDEAGPAHDRLYAKALVLRSDATTAVFITVDAVAIGEIGYIGHDYLPAVRAALEAELHIPPTHVLVNASHCHGIVCPDVAPRTIEAVRQAVAALTPVTVGAGVGHEDRIMENRRMKLADGTEADVRHAYALPPDAQVVAAGPLDPEIGVLRFDRLDGSTLAVVFNFACHPIMGVPSGANTADLSGLAATAIEDNLDPGAIALFVQGCAGDINPIFYKDVHHPRDAEVLGDQLALSTLQAIRAVETRADDRLTILHETLTLPRADLAQRIVELEAERERLTASLGGTTLNLKTFLELVTKYNLSEEFPSYYAHRYLHDDAIGHDDLRRLDADNRRNLEAYLRNIYTMEELSRLQINLALLRKHQQQYLEAGSRTIDVELLGVRVGDFVLVTSPGELTVQIGLNLKARSPHELTFVAGYTNGYIYYAPTAEQLQNVGRAQEDSDCILAPAWQETFENAAEALLRRL